MDRGYVKLWRKTLDSGLLQSPTALQLFTWLLLIASRVQRKQAINGSVVELQPGEAIFTRVRAANELGITEKQARTALDKLKLMQIVATRGANKYTIVSIINWNTYQISGPANGPTNGPCMGLEGANSGPTEELASSNNNKKEELRNINTPPLPPRGGSESAASETHPEKAESQEPAQEPLPKSRKRGQTQYSAAFEAFWALYPRKTGKDAAWKIWQRRSHELPGPDELAAILERQCHCEQWQRDGGQYIPHPSTWLSQGRWMDEAETEQWTPKPANW